MPVRVVMSEVNALELVTFLLEDRPRVCAQCQAEHGVQATKGETHGLCYRHAVDLWARDIYDGDRQRAAQELSKRPASYFSPDMGQAQAA